MTREATARVLGAMATTAAIVALLAAGCGGRRPSLAAQRQAADSLIAEGCYHCLDEAVGRYVGLPPARDAGARVNDTQLFRALILLALREKELGIGASQHLKQAGLLAPRTTVPVSVNGRPRSSRARTARPAPRVACPEASEHGSGR